MIQSLLGVFTLVSVRGILTKPSSDKAIGVCAPRAHSLAQLFPIPPGLQPRILCLGWEVPQSFFLKCRKNQECPERIPLPARAQPL